MEAFFLCLLPEMLKAIVLTQKRPETPVLTIAEKLIFFEKKKSAILSFFL